MNESSWWLWRTALLICSIGVCLAPNDLYGQYFGRNKVLWEQFDFEVLETAHFRIHYYPPDARSGEYTAVLAERWYARLARFFDHDLEQKIPIIIYRDHADFQQTAVTSGLIGEGTGGFTESVRNRVVLPLTGINADNDHVIGHELAHAFQFHLLKERGSQTRQAQPTQIPLWVVEGLAEYLSEGRRDPTTAMWMRDAVLHDRLPDPEKFFQLRLSPYQYGQAIWAWLAGEQTDDVARQFFERAIRGGLNAAMLSLRGQERAAFFEEFHSALRSAYGPILDARETPADLAEPLLNIATTGTSVNYAPALSPDGRWLAFLSTRQLDVDLYLADAKTGVIVRKLVSAEGDPHFDYLSYLDSSVAWSPDGRRFAFAVFAEGERRLAIYDLERGALERRIDLPGVAGMRQPAWSPDGRFLAFSATVEGASDLYWVELATGALKRLTADPYTAIQPAFSPDGRQIIFVTDRGPQTDIEIARFGDLQLALLQLDDLSIEVLPIFEHGKHIDPHFSPDGSSVYFIAEPDGIADVVRYDFSTRRTERITALKTGVTGITAHSPAISVAADSGTLVFSTLEDGDWNIYRLEPPEVAPEVVANKASTAGTLPPISDDYALSIVEDYLDNAEFGLDRTPVMARYAYEPRVQLANVGPATIAVGTSSVGTYAASAISLYFNDMLNRHQIATAVQTGSTYGGLLDIEDTFGVDVTYLNQVRRLKWGARAARIPYLRTATFGGIGTVEIDGTTVPAEIYERLIQVVSETDLSAVAHYPLSLNNRFEMELGISEIAFENELERLVFPSGLSGYREELGLPSPEEIDLERASVAFVRDTSRFGYVSPAQGTRFRFESEWTSGDLDFQTNTLDYRRYFLREPVTIAVRALHIGRRGSSAEDPRLAPLDIARSSLVRGYEFESFDLAECTAGPDFSVCPELDRLLGSRIATLNFEVRLALLGTEDFGIFNVPFAPTEALFFVDIGAAWNSGDSVDLRFDRDTLDRVPVVSAGIAVRTLIAGALPIEWYWAHPYQRPGKDSETGFRIGIGW
jgi:Tol biopolymer transport system component